MKASSDLGQDAAHRVFTSIKLASLPPGPSDRRHFSVAQVERIPE